MNNWRKTFSFSYRKRYANGIASLSETLRGKRSHAQRALRLERSDSVAVARYERRNERP